jgi:hypothetical protein
MARKKPGFEPLSETGRMSLSLHLAQNTFRSRRRRIDWAGTAFNVVMAVLLLAMFLAVLS